MSEVDPGLRQYLLHRLAAVHSYAIFRGRAHVLARELARRLPQGASVADVGCGNGMIARLMMSIRPDLQIHGYDVIPREHCRIPCCGFDGQHLPLADGEVDFAMFVDVLHHVIPKQIDPLLRDAARAARNGLIIKDHLCESSLDRVLLQMMDWVANRPYGVSVKCRYWCRREWTDCFRRNGLRVEYQTDRVPIYPFPLSLIFRRRMHLIVRLSFDADN